MLQFSGYFCTAEVINRCFTINDSSKTSQSNCNNESTVESSEEVSYLQSRYTLEVKASRLE